MKSCLTRGSQYSDNTLKFYLQDRRPLAVVAAAVAVYAVLTAGVIGLTLLRNFPGDSGSGISNDVFTQPPAEKERAKTEITHKVNTWKSLFEAHESNAYVKCYDYVVNYYEAGDVPRSRVRSEKELAMSMYRSIRVTASNISVEIDPGGNRATAFFDKEWVFAGNSHSEGKTRAQLEFKKIKGNWLIAGEKDLKVYYQR
jgi:hypothetical protein